LKRADLNLAPFLPLVSNFKAGPNGEPATMPATMPARKTTVEVEIFIVRRSETLNSIHLAV
jgi:hypothetical protein